MQTDELVGLYKKGVITQGELVFALGEHITAANVGAVMSEIPSEFLPEIREWAFTSPATGGVMIGSNLSEQGERDMKERVQQAIPALREWFHQADAAKKSGAPATSSPADPETLDGLNGSPPSETRQPQ